MTKLTSIQILLLTNASQRIDGSLLPAPETAGAEAQLKKTFAALLKRGVVEEAEVTGPDQIWREEGARKFGLAITAAGRQAIGLVPESVVAPVEVEPAVPSSAQLRLEWQQVVGSPAPAAFGKDMLARGVAYRLQEQVHGGMLLATARQLAEARKQLARGQAPNPQARLRPGTQLARDWHGRTHHVLVLEDGYSYRDRSYRSLTAIARDITGAAWSGPRFFGLTSKRLVRKADRDAA